MCRYFFACVRPSWYGWPRYLHLLYFYAIFHILCFLAELEHLSQKRIFPKIRSLSRAEASVILLPLCQLRSNRITDLYPHFRLEIVILHSASLHSGPQTLDAPGLIGIRSAHDPLAPPSELRSLPTLETAVFASLTPT